MEVVVTTGAIGRAKLHSNHHHQQTNIQFFYRPDAILVAQTTVSKHWREIIIIIIIRAFGSSLYRKQNDPDPQPIGLFYDRSTPLAAGL